MKGQTHGGKGSTPRPTNKRRFDENYEAIFNNKAPEERVELDEGFHITESDGRQRESKLREHVEGAGIQGQADQEQAVKFNFCPRCGKRLSGNPDWVHTCTPPEAYEGEISTVTLPENKLTELQIKASQRDELLEALINALPKLHTGDELPMSYYADKKGVLGDALRAIAKAKGEQQ